MGVSQILSTKAHRPWTLSVQPWRYYQELNNAVFLHWKVPADVLRSLIPKDIQLDLFNGEAWVSVVAFTMEKLRIKRLPSVPGISDFHEINVRTYVTRDGKPGVYFLSMEAEKQLAVFISKNISGLPYRKATINRTGSERTSAYRSKNTAQVFEFDAVYEPVDQAYTSTDLDRWLVERYCLYFDKGRRLFRYDIHHLEWNIQRVQLHNLTLKYTIRNLVLGERSPDLAHFSPGIKVIAWPRLVVSKNV
jgi:uncharacterized protein YqjF (DUF2071 family)